MDLVGDLALLDSNNRADVAAMPWQMGRVRESVNYRESTYKQSLAEEEEGNDQSNMVDQYYYMADDSRLTGRDLHADDWPPAEDEVDERHMTEYERMKKRFAKSISDSRYKIAADVNRNREEFAGRKQMILEKINVLRQGQSVPAHHVVSKVPESRIDSHYTQLSEVRLMPAARKYFRPKKPTKVYKFDTKKMTEAVKLREYEEEKQERKKHDYLAESKKMAMKIDPETRKLREVAKLADKKPTQRKFNSESQRMVITRMRAADNKADLDSHKLKCGVMTEELTAREDGYLDAIRLKMNFINKLL